MSISNTPNPGGTSTLQQAHILATTCRKSRRIERISKSCCNDALEIIKIVQAQISAHGDTAAVKFKGLCEDLNRDILDAVKLLQKKPQGFAWSLQGSTQIEQHYKADHRLPEQDPNFALEFCDVLLIDASTRDTIETALKNIAATRNIGKTPQDALQWLRCKAAPWLLLFDNADDPKLNLNNFLPLCNHGNIVITSRNPELRVYAGAKEENISTNQEIAAEIVKALCYLPLAIIQAGAFIAKSGALSRYLELYRQNQERLLCEKPAQSHNDYSWTVYTTWQISFEQLSPLAATLLQLCSFIHHQGISEKIFCNASTYKFRSSGPSQKELEKPQAFISQFLTSDGSWDSLRFLELTTELRAYSLINFHLETGLFSIHPLVHVWSQSTMTNPKVYHSFMTAIMAMSIGATDVTPDFNAYFALIYHYCGKLTKAQDLGVAALETHKIILGDNHPDTLMVMANLAATARFLGQLKNAAELEDIVLKTYKSLYGNNHSDTLTAMANLAATYRDLGQLGRAAELQVVVLEKTKTILGEDHPDTLLAMGSLAFTYHELGQLREAEELEALVLKKQKTILGEDHPETTLGQLKEAEKLKVMVLNKRKTILGEDHPATLWAMGNLAVTYKTLGELKKAEELEVVVVEKRKTLLGEDHPHTLSAMGNLAWTYHKLGQLKEAEELQILVLKKWKAILEEDHPDTLGLMGNLASTYHALGQLNDAEQLEVFILKKQQDILGDEHPHTLCTMQKLQQTYQKLGKLNETESLRVLVEEIERRKA
ncbi:hypothetical protein B0H14DRAFT_3610469 [Mycena olivaceomarginata]|nr:hypothetical protein B0H14DRAFT_3610469 [Mycena olivaceomarginata]